MGRRHLAAVAGLGVAAIAVATAGAASATPQLVTSCGSTVTGYARLATDLTCASGFGVTLTGDATLDLDGHTLTGPYLNDLDAVGVVTSTTGRSRIVDGTIERWWRGVSGNVDREGRPILDVRDVRFFADNTGIDAIRSTVTVDRSVFDDGEQGIYLTHSSSGIVTRSTFNANGQAGVETSGSRGAIVTGSTFTGASSVGIRCGDVCGITGNVFRGVANGVDSYGSNRARLTVVGNDFIDNFGSGYDPGSTTGARHDVHDNRFIGNTAGVRVRATGGKAAVRRNLFDGNMYAVLAEGDGDYSILLDRNTIRNSTVDGINAASGGLRLARNSAVDNAGWGIYAPGSVDLGGNTASGNGNEPQCVGVVCS